MEKAYLFILITAICLASNLAAGRKKNGVFKQLFPKCGDTRLLDAPKDVPGKRSGAIVGGHESELNAWPWMTALGFRLRVDNRFQLVCGGALIHKRYILTAAHCCPQRIEIVRLGHHDLTKEADGVIDAKVDKLICHEQFKIETYQDDVALAKLTKDIEFSDVIRPICLPPPGRKCFQNFDGKDLTVTGWGKTSEGGAQSDVLQEVDVYGISLEECKQAYPTVINNKRLCAGFRGGGKDACQGDSGGPLMYKATRPSGPVYVVVGIVSAGKGCARPGYYGIYTRLTEYVPWILENIAA